MRWYNDRSDHLGDNSLSSLWSLGQMCSETLHPREVPPFKNLWEVDGSPSWCKRLRILRTARAIASPSVVAVAPQQWADFRSCRSDLEFLGIRYHSIPRGFGRISHGLYIAYLIYIFQLCHIFSYCFILHIVSICFYWFLMKCRQEQMPRGCSSLHSVPRGRHGHKKTCDDCGDYMETIRDGKLIRHP